MNNLDQEELEELWDEVVNNRITLHKVEDKDDPLWFMFFVQNNGDSSLVWDIENDPRVQWFKEQHHLYAKDGTFAGEDNM